MVSTETVFKQVEDLSRKEKSAFAGSVAFNRQQALVQSALFDYFVARYEQNREVPEALLPFITMVNLPAVAQIVTYPDDHRSTLDVGARLVKTVPGGEPDISVHPASYLASNEENVTVTSAVRKPDVHCKRFYWANRAGGFKIHPSAIKSVELKYLAAPPDAFRAFTVDAVNDVENPDPDNTIDFIWPAEQQANLVDLFLLYRGLQTRNTDLIQWVAAKKQIVK